MPNQLPQEFGDALGSVAGASVFMFAQFFKTLIDKNVVDETDLRSFLNDVEKAGWAEQAAGRPTQYLPALLVMVERLRRDLLGDEPERRV